MSSVLSVPVVGMEELQVIKKELTLIKTQIDGLLDSLDRMDTQRSDHKGEALIYKDSGIRWVQHGATLSDLTSRPFSGNMPLSDFCLISSSAHKPQSERFRIGAV